MARRTKPVNDAIVADGGTAMLHGQRASDGSNQAHHQHLGMQFLTTPIECAGPIWDWTDADIAAYVRAHGLTLPKQYTLGNTSLECAVCPAHHGLTEQNITMNLSPPLANVAQTMGRGLRLAVVRAMAAIDAEIDQGPKEDRAQRWGDVQGLMAAALHYDASGKTLDEVRVAYLAGSYELFAVGKSALLVEIVSAEAGRVLHMFLAAGDLGQIVSDLIPQAELFGKLNGCFAAAIGGRRGWLRVLRGSGYEFAGKSEAAYSWVAAKGLAA
jgi:hypothetical protein